MCEQANKGNQEGEGLEDMADCTPDYPVLGMQSGEEVGPFRVCAARWRATKNKGGPVYKITSNVRQLHLGTRWP